MIEETLQIADQTLSLVRKDIKNVHLTVRPPDGKIRIAAPLRMERRVISSFAITKLPWIRRQQKKLQKQEREEAREFLNRESHYVWGRRYLLEVSEVDAPVSISAGTTKLHFQHRQHASQAQKQAAFDQWHRQLVREKATELIAIWERKLGVQAGKLFIQKMKTKWGSCNPQSGAIRLNSELAKKPLRCLEYVIVHELAHLIEPNHGPKFVQTLDRHLPDWQHRKEELSVSPGHLAEI